MNEPVNSNSQSQQDDPQRKENISLLWVGHSHPFFLLLTEYILYILKIKIFYIFKKIIYHRTQINLCHKY